MSITATAALSADIIEILQQSFSRQGALRPWNARLTSIGHGTCEVVVPMSDLVIQQHGFFHGGVIATIADVAGGYAANTLLMPTHECLSAEFKVNIMSPGIGEALIGRGKVIKAGKSLVVTTAEIFTLSDGVEKLCAIMQQTLFVIARK